MSQAIEEKSGEISNDWMSQEVCKWLVNGLVSPTYKWGTLGL